MGTHKFILYLTLVSHNAYAWTGETLECRNADNSIVYNWADEYFSCDNWDPLLTIGCGPTLYTAEKLVVDDEVIIDFREQGAGLGKLISTNKYKRKVVVIEQIVLEEEKSWPVTTAILTGKLVYPFSDELEDVNRLNEIVLCQRISQEPNIIDRTKVIDGHLPLLK